MKRYVVIEWEDETADPDEGETGGAYEYAEATTAADVKRLIAEASAEAIALVASGGATWATVLVGTGHEWDEVTIETADMAYCIQ